MYCVCIFTAVEELRELSEANDESNNDAINLFQFLLLFAIDSVFDLATLFFCFVINYITFKFWLCKVQFEQHGLDIFVERLENTKAFQKLTALTTMKLCTNR